MTPFRVGGVLVDPPVLLAPMEDVTSLAFRLIAKRIAKPGLMFTEFVSAMAVHHGAAKTIKKMAIHPDERPLGVQIFGGEPETMVETALIAEEMGADIVDINMGCWVPKVCRTGAGAALLKDPALAEEIVGRVVRAVSVPVTVKVRAGWDYSLFAAPELARRFEGAGAKMLTLHARFARQGFEGEADWSLIQDLRAAVKIPLIGNGDVKTPADAFRMFRETGCDGVMVGRAAISNPWALRDICRAVSVGSPLDPHPPTLDERIETALEHLRLTIISDLGVPGWEEALTHPRFAEAERWSVRHLRGQVPLYVKGVTGAAAARERLTKCSTVGEVEGILSESRRVADASTSPMLRHRDRQLPEPNDQKLDPD